MSRRLRVYIAGPISQGDLRANIAQATEAGRKLIEAGFAPLVPHLTCYMGGPTPDIGAGGIDPSVWYEVDLPWVAVADAVLRLPGESVGAEKECALARAMGIPVYSDASVLLLGEESSSGTSAV